MNRPHCFAAAAYLVMLVTANAATPAIVPGQVNQAGRIDPEQMPARERPGPVSTVLGATGVILGGILGGRHKGSKNPWSYPIMYGLAGGAVGGLTGYLIDRPIMMARNAYAMRTRSCVDTAGFIRTVNGDTLAVERVVFTRTGVSGVQANRTGVVRYETALSEGLVVLRLNVFRWAPGQALSTPPTRQVFYRLIRDTANFWFEGMHSPMLQRPVRGDVVPRLDGVVGLEEVMIRRVAARRQFEIPTFDVMSADVRTAHFQATGLNALEMRVGSDDVADLRIDAEGRLRAASYFAGKATAIMLQRVPCGVVEPILQSWHR